MVKILLLITTLFSAITLLWCAPYFWKQIKRAKQSRKQICVAWVLMFLGLGVFFQRSSMVEGVTSLDRSALFQFFCFALAACLIAMRLMTTSVGKSVTFPLKALAIYSMIGIISSVFSPIPIISFYKASIVLMVVFLFASAIYTFSRTGDGNWPLEIAYFLATIFCFGAVSGAFIWPEIGLQPSSGAIGVLLYGTLPMMNANELGSFGFFVFIIGLRRIFEKAPTKLKAFYYSQALLGFTVLFLAQSRTALIGAALGVLIFAVGIPKMRKVAIGGFVAILCLVAYEGIKSDFKFFDEVGDSALAYAQRGQKEGGLQSFNDRIDTWFTVGFEKISQAPFMGHGFDVGIAYDISGKYGKSHMHNSHFQVLANNGIVGYVAWATFFISMSLYIFRYAKRNFPAKTLFSRYSLECGVIALEIAVRTLTGSVMVTHQWSLMIFVGIYIFFESHRRHQKLQKSMSGA